MKRGIFINSKKSLCSIWQVGRMCFEALNYLPDCNNNTQATSFTSKTSSPRFVLEYTEDQCDLKSRTDVDFIIVNWHPVVCNWFNPCLFNFDRAKTFAIVTEVAFQPWRLTPVDCYPPWFSHYIVLDPTIEETASVHAFPRPLIVPEHSMAGIITGAETSSRHKAIRNIDDKSNEAKEVIIRFETETEKESEKKESTFKNSYNNDFNPNNNPVKIGMNGLPTKGKDWHLVVREACKSFPDGALVRFHIPEGTYTPGYSSYVEEVRVLCRKELESYPGAKVSFEISNEILKPDELVTWLKQNDLNCYFYNRTRAGAFEAGLAACTDQAVISGQPLLVSDDITFRHVHAYIPPFPQLSVKEALLTKPVVARMYKDWSSKMFADKFVSILLCVARVK